MEALGKRQTEALNARLKETIAGSLKMKELVRKQEEVVKKYEREVQERLKGMAVIG